MVHESDLNEKIATKEDLKILATKSELKGEQQKVKNCKHLSQDLFIGQSYFGNAGSQNYLTF